ncbi:hypothetical protein TSTA_035130 [Talaromyces stipitatus ATCC 10500]|uniref:Uncharacterized protein n=1 Tax=Talaromyces stipitatus (strain ATCC 10500 / CBS 375.48 / QM 6759 / NRRL 1006) TaxID=441959 RepID=B8M764_TALSN|nr:uncharacterized protein TSTA_035130 [Talaromyces stipitatus ATCC 10500]EED20284.1 hypothetical protein TSTA_035130 [Talaromyces stipitatus ATCC 10500]
MEVSVDQETPPPRKRRKVEGESSEPLFWFGQTNGVMKFGVGLLQPFSQAIDPHIDSISLNLLGRNLFPAKLSRNQFVSDDSDGPRSKSLSPRTADADSTAQSTSERAECAPMRPRQYQELGGSLAKNSLATQKSRALDSQCTLLPPPRVHVRSSSAFPELNDINEKHIPAAAQFDRRRRVNSQPALYHGTEEWPHNSALQSREGGIRDRSQRPSEDFTSENSSEQAPLLSRSRQLGSGMNAPRSQKHQSLGAGTADGVNETRQHIGKCKGAAFERKRLNRYLRVDIIKGDCQSTIACV